MPLRQLLRDPPQLVNKTTRRSAGWDQCRGLMQQEATRVFRANLSIQTDDFDRECVCMYAYVYMWSI
jgi:hypothetical protein